MSAKQGKIPSTRRKYPDSRYPKCRTCKAWFEHDYDHQHDVRLGQCRLRPPKTMTNEFADWIETEEGDFCLEHVAAARIDLDTKS